MINYEALFKLSYGMYIVCSGNKEHGNGYISNTVFQVSSEPPKFAACCNKDNYTVDLIKDSNAFSISVLHKDANPDIFGRFGYKSGRTINKMDAMQVKYGESGVPIVLNDVVTFLECRVVQTVDVGTHWLFIGELIQADILDDVNVPLTYQYYRQVKKGIAPKNSPTYIDKSKLKTETPKAKSCQFKCTVCSYIYDEEVEGTKFADLPEDWVCPVCGADKSEFEEIS